MVSPKLFNFINDLGSEGVKKINFCERKENSTV